PHRQRARLARSAARRRRAAARPRDARRRGAPRETTERRRRTAAESGRHHDRLDPRARLLQRRLRRRARDVPRPHPAPRPFESLANDARRRGRRRDRRQGGRIRASVVGLPRRLRVGGGAGGMVDVASQDHGVMANLTWTAPSALWILAVIPLVWIAMRAARTT